MNTTKIQLCTTLHNSIQLNTTLYYHQFPLYLQNDFIPIRLTFAIQSILSQHFPQFAVLISIAYIAISHKPIDQVSLLAVNHTSYLFQKHQGFPIVPLKAHYEFFHILLWQLNVFLIL